MLYTINSLQVEMGYGEFREKLLNQVQERLSETHIVNLAQEEKNNSTESYALCIRKKGESFSAGVYLEEPYLQFLNGRKMSEIMELILERMEESLENTRNFAQSSEEIKEQWKSRIFYHLINLQDNQKMLREVPHKIFHDYAIVFRVMLDENWERKISMAVRNELMEEWGVSVEELWNEAYNNMLRNCPANIFTLEEETESNRDEILDYTPENGAMHVLTNTMTFLGAGAILYEGILEQIGSRLKSDYYLLPSSLHEWVIVPKRFGDFPMMQGMVEKVNTSDVKDEEILGTKVYFYDNEQKKLIVDPEE